MTMVEILQKKRDGGVLSREELSFFVQGATDGSLPDYQISALLMACCIRGLNEEETAYLTEAMTNSGSVMDFSSVQGIVTDKHSTGGVADTTTLLVVPLVAACGVKVVAMSGRGLGHTGGTLDKMQSIPGYRVEVSNAELLHLIDTVGGTIVGQTADLAPADKRIYAIRDVTATVENIGLISASIMSKKLASGTQAIVLDVKTGNGAFMKTLEDSFALARSMVSTGSKLHRDVLALVTDMNQPLGASIGNGLDVCEILKILSGERQDSPLCRLSIELSAHMLTMAKRTETQEEARQLLWEALKSGAAKQKFYEMVAAQGGDPSVLDHPERLIQTKQVCEICAQSTGYIAEMDCVALGRASQKLGAGRLRIEDEIDPAVGIWMHVRIGDYVKEGEPLATFYVNDATHLKEAEAQFLQAVSIVSERVQPPALIYGLVTNEKEERFV